MPERSRMAAADAAWLGVEAPENLMMVTAVLWFDEPLDRERLREVLVQRMLTPYPKFTRRPVPAGVATRPQRRPVRPAYWADDPDFDLDDHLVEVRLPDSGDDAAMRRLVATLLSRPLDMRHSPWQFHLVRSPGDPAGTCSAVVARLHHCLADGIALAGVLLSLADGAPGLPAVRRTPPARHGVLDSVRFGLHVAGTAVRVLLLARDPRTRLRGPLGVAKDAAWTPPRDLAAVKAAGVALGATINDVMVAAVAGGVRRYLEAHGDRLRDLRVFVPVNLRPPDEPVPADLGNRFGLVFLRLPVAEPYALRRVHLVRARMRAVRAAEEATATFGLLSVMGRLPAWLQRIGLAVLGAKSTAVVTNVPGPRAPVTLAGSRLGRVVFWVPQAGSVGVGVSIFSYAGRITVGVAADVRLVREPQQLTAAIDAELDALIVAARRAAAPAGIRDH